MQAIAVKMFRDSMLHLIDGVHSFMSGVYEDLWGDTMREDAIINWEKQFGLSPAPTDSLTNRARMVEAAWAMTGYCGPGYIQAALQFAGFDVVVKENDPAINLVAGRTIEFGTFATAPQFGFEIFNSGTYNGYLLGNGELQLNSGALLDPIVAPEGDAGETQTQFASHASALQFATHASAPQFGSGATDWAYVFTIESLTGELALIPSERRTALESLVLRLKPAHLGVFMRVRYN